MAQYERACSELKEYLSRKGWWCQHADQSDRPEVGYFCAEFGLTECIPLYSGGLGVLAGDHLKSCSELCIPLVGVGLLYQQGYFRQRLNADGWQLEMYPRNDFYEMPLQLATRFDSEGDESAQPIMTEVEFPGRVVKVRIWVVHVGRVRLYLLDTNVPDNAPEDREITDQLYGGDHEKRIRQEIILGIGGVNMLISRIVRRWVISVQSLV